LLPIFHREVVIDILCVGDSQSVHLNGIDTRLRDVIIDDYVVDSMWNFSKGTDCRKDPAIANYTLINVFYTD